MHTSVFEAEILAIEQYAYERLYQDARIYVLLISQVALKAVRTYTFELRLSCHSPITLKALT